jgi:hypothetical protein
LISKYVAFRKDRDVLFCLHLRFVKIQLDERKNSLDHPRRRPCGAAVGFILANSINRSELSNLRAENERLKSATPASDPKNELTEEEINTTIAQADSKPGDFDTQRNVGLRSIDTER